MAERLNTVLVEPSNLFDELCGPLTALGFTVTDDINVTGLAIMIYRGRSGAINADFGETVHVVSGNTPEAIASEIQKLAGGESSA